MQVPRGSRALRGGSLSPVAGGARAPRLIGLTTYEGGARVNSATLVSRTGRCSGRATRSGCSGSARRCRSARSSLAAPDVRARQRRRGSVHPLLLARDGTAPVRLACSTATRTSSPGWDGASSATRTRSCSSTSRTTRGSTGRARRRCMQRLAAIRAVELRTDLVRAANAHQAGAAQWIDETGRVRTRQGTGRRAHGTPGLRARASASTWYARHGDLPVWLAIVALAPLAVLARRRARSALRDRRRVRVELVEHEALRVAASGTTC